MIQRLALGATGLILFGLTCLILWTHVDRTGALEAICEAGLPNLSRPPEVDAEDLGCAIVAPKAVYSGLLISGFEASNFSSAEFPKVAGQMSGDDGRSWYNCPKGGCDAELDMQLDRDYLRSCMSDQMNQTGFASLKVEGWVTLSQGAFGHLGAYPREFYASRILSVGPPPKRVVDDWIKGFRRMELCDDQVG